MIDHDSHASAIALFNAASMRTVGGSSDGDAQQPTELGLILIGAGVPAMLWVIDGDGATNAWALKQRFIAARFLRELADRIEAKNLLEGKEET